MNNLFFIPAALFLGLGHFFKSLRWKQFISVHDDIGLPKIIKSLVLGYGCDFFLPCHIGDFIKGIYLGKKSKNGFAYIISTIIIDRFFDVAAVTLILTGFCLTDTPNEQIVNSFSLFMLMMTALIILAIIAFCFTKQTKKVILNIAKIFNEKIAFNILLFTWSGITCFKDVIKAISKIKLLINTILMWTMYMLSYFLFARFLSENGHPTGTEDIFCSFFAGGSFYKPTITEILNSAMPPMMFVFVAVPLVVLFVAGTTLPNKNDSDEFCYTNLLPQINQRDRFMFLQEYFSGDNRDFLKNYIEMSENVTILKDCSAGSNAATILCMNNDGMFFRKYAYGSEAEKLGVQYKWIDTFKNALPLASVSNFMKSSSYLYYDMPYKKDFDSFFNYIHNMDIACSKSVMSSLLSDLDKFYKENPKPYNKQELNRYINEKVINNISLINSFKDIKALLKYKTLIINGKEYLNLPALEEQFSEEFMEEAFSCDYCCDIHGDLTIENIVAGNDGYYLIDPNYNSYSVSFLDYSKLLQSLHGNYEFFMMTSPASVEENKLTVKLMKSSAYEKLYDFYRDYLAGKFSEKELKSIYCHEIIHWLRLMPYKIRNDSERALNFYCGLIIVMNEVIVDEVYKCSKTESSIV